MGWGNILERFGKNFNPSGIFPLPVREHLFNNRPLLVGMTAAQIRTYNRILFYFGIFYKIFFGTVHHRSYHDVALIIRQQFGRHGFYFPVEEHIKKKGLKQILPVMPQCYFGCSYFGCGTVEDPPSQSGAE